MKKTMITFGVISLIIALTGCSEPPSNNQKTVTETSIETTEEITEETTEETTEAPQTQYEQLSDADRNLVDSLVEQTRSVSGYHSLTSANVAIYARVASSGMSWAFVRFSDAIYRCSVGDDGYVFEWKEVTQEDFEDFKDSSFSDESVEKINTAFHEKLYGETEISTDSNESGSDEITISNKDISKKGDKYVISGSITNNLNYKVCFVKLKVSLLDSSGNCIDTESTYGCGDEGFEPGESTKFDCYIDYDSNAEGFQVEVYDYSM